MKSSPWQGQLREIVETASNAGVPPNEIEDYLQYLRDHLYEKPGGQIDDEEADADLP